MVTLSALVSDLDAELVRQGYKSSTMLWYRGCWRRLVNSPGFGGGSLVESQATRLVRSPASYRASNSVGGLPPQAP